MKKTNNVTVLMPANVESEPIVKKICKNCDYFFPTKNKNGVGLCVHEIETDDEKFENETCADFLKT